MIPATLEVLNVETRKKIDSNLSAHGSRSEELLNLKFFHVPYTTPCSMKSCYRHYLQEDYHCEKIPVKNVCLEFRIITLF